MEGKSGDEGKIGGEGESGGDAKVSPARSVRGDRHHHKIPLCLWRVLSSVYKADQKKREKKRATTLSYCRWQGQPLPLPPQKKKVRHVPESSAFPTPPLSL